MQVYGYYVYDFNGKYEMLGMVIYCFECECYKVLYGVWVLVCFYLGIVGVVFDKFGWVSIILLGKYGGNIDNWCIGVGFIMYYLVQVEGGLFLIGDLYVL